MIAVRQVASESPRTSTTPNREAQKQRSLDQACEAARIMDEYRGQNTLVLDLTAITPIVDYFVITTGSSSRQMKAMQPAAGVLPAQGQAAQATKQLQDKARNDVAGALQQGADAARNAADK